MKYDITASIVTYQNDSLVLKRAMNSFLETKLNIKLLIIDNSPENHIESFIDNPRIEYIYNNKNMGFGTAHNIAIRKIAGSSHYHIIMNPDTYYNSKTLVKLFEYMNQHRDIGLIMPKVLYPDGSIQYLCKLFPSPFTLFARRFIPISWINRLVNRNYELRTFDYNTIIDVPFLSGCFMFIRSEVFKSIGLFDEKFFMYMEDLDFCRRVKKKYRTVFFPDQRSFMNTTKAPIKVSGS